MSESNSGLAALATRGAAALSQLSVLRSRRTIVTVCAVLFLSMLAFVGTRYTSYPDYPSLNSFPKIFSPPATAPGAETTLTTTLTSPAPSAAPGIPKQIWQIMLPRKAAPTEPFEIKPEALKDTATWLAMNPGYQYDLVGADWANSFVEKHFADQPDVSAIYRTLRNPGQRSDLLRYLILHTLGGVYADTDTVALKPIDQWVTAEQRDTVRLIVGIEFDRQDGGYWADIPHDLQFCQWTIAAAPGHAVFQAMADRIAASIRDLTREHNVSVADLQPSSFEVMNSTGPAAWTDVVFDQLRIQDPSFVDWTNLTGMRAARQYGDILVLPIDGFGMGQPHSGSSTLGPVPDNAFVRHLFSGSWRGGDRRRWQRAVRRWFNA